MIRSLHLKNFKCFESQRFEFAPLTLLTGLNGMGKSSVLHSLLLLRQSYQQGLLQNDGLSLKGELAQLGMAQDVFYEDAEGDEFGFDLDFDMVTSGDHAVSWRFNYEPEADVVPLASPQVPKEVYEESLFNNNFHYLQAERIGPRTTFPTSDYIVRKHRQLGASGEYTAHFLQLFGSQKIINSAIAHPKEEIQTLKAQIEAWMSEVSPGVRIEITSYTDMDLIKLQYTFAIGRTVSKSHRSTNVGFGITYILPVLVALLSSAQGSLVLLENPEAHLHPQGQAKLGELMARVASCGVQVIVETHSDHVLNGIRVAVKKGLLPPEKVRLHFFGRQEEDGQVKSSVISPRMDRNGRIDQWPDGFFDQWDKSLEQLLGWAT